MFHIRDRLAPHALSIIILGCCLVVIQTIAVLDARNGFYKKPSNRYRFHAIPVALSQTYHERTHDYTAWKKLTSAFQDPNRNLTDLIGEYANAATPVGDETYYWAADDRGLSDYVVLAFRLYGPDLRSLSRLYILLLSGSVLLFAVGFWRSPLALLLPLLALLGILFLTCAFHVRAEIPLVDGSVWSEEVALYESRIFEVLAVTAWLHLALIAVSARPVSLYTWTAAVPQAALILFLYHARSSLGWQYLALFSVIAARSCWLARSRWLRGLPIASGAIGRPLVVGLLLAFWLIGLNAYKRATYNAAYFAEGGSRTFWHNALIGFCYNPALKQSYNLSLDDAPVFRLVFRRIKETRDPEFDSAASLDLLMRGATDAKLDWTMYEQVAREIYFEVWKRHPRAALECYFWNKPKDAARQIALVSRAVGSAASASDLLPLSVGLIVLACVFIMVGRQIARNEAARRQLAACCWLSLAFLGFSSIPALAFYAALPTMSGFYVATILCSALWGMRCAVWLLGKQSRIVGESKGPSQASPEKGLPQCTNAA